MGQGVGGLFAAVALATAVLAAAGPHARADGALAVGSTGDVVKDGIAFGMVVNEPKDKAVATAVKRCRTFKARAAAERCQVVATFSGECFAVAYDPKPGTPGAGWGIGPDQLTANLNAIAMCEKTAGAGRTGFCQVESGGCDTNSQAKTALQDTDKAAPPQAAEPAPPQTPDIESRWTELRKSLSEEQRSRINWDVLVLLLVAGAVAWAAYVFIRPLMARGKAEPASGKSSKAKAKEKEKEKAQRSPVQPKSARVTSSRTSSTK